MKIAFIFTDQPELAKLHRDERFNSFFELPDTVKSLPDAQEQIIAIGHLVGSLTKASLHLTCADIGLKNYPLKQVDPPDHFGKTIFFQTRAMNLFFEGIFHRADGADFWYKRKLSIFSPHSSLPVPRIGSYNFTFTWREPDLIDEVERIQSLSQRLVSLLNTAGDWRCTWFHPFVKQPNLITQSNKHFRRVKAEEKKSIREEEKRKAREANLAEKLASAPSPAPLLTHGAGRTVGARPGIYKGIQMRSQLEIRFAAELDERGIKWIYEGEALSESSYLVDFFLPDLGTWVEVKGRFEARDKQVLPLVAKYLKTERKQRLLVYTGAGKCCVVNPSGFREIERKNFWSELFP